MKSWSSTAVPHVPLPHDGDPVRVFDTASGQLRPVTGVEGTARLYVCGITPYDATHVGHAATYVTFDLLQRAWLDAGLRVEYVQNVTDVDEPLLERAARDGVEWQDLATREIELFFADMEALRVLAPDHYVGAVEGIPDDVDAVQRLLAQGLAYPVPVPEDQATVPEAEAADIYLDLSTQPSFGTVSGWSRQDMMAVFAERGGDPDRSGKRDPLDPLLWRAGRVGEPHWDGGSLGQGRPGWHIECSTIAQRHLGTPFDVQGGGTDLIFPHHEMSAVQATALSGQPFAHTYVHQSMVGLDGEKMSKSKGNLVLVSRLRASGVEPMALRLALLAQHYRTEWEWTDAVLREAHDRLDLWQRAADMAANEGPTDLGRATVARMRRALADDLNSPEALLAVDTWATNVVAGEPVSGLVVSAVDALLGVQL